MKNKMKKVAVPVMALSLLFSPTMGSVASAYSDLNTKEDVIVVYKNEEGKNKVLEESVSVDHEFETVNAVSASLTKKDIRELEKDPDIARIEPNLTFTIAGGENVKVLNRSLNRSELSTANVKPHWNVEMVNATKAREDGYTGKGIKIAVIDSGIAKHNELNIAGGVSTVDYTNSWFDDNGHGTHVAGIIGAKEGIASVNGADVVGVAPNVELYAVKAMNQDGDGTLQDVLEGIDWAIQNNMDIINLSLGTQVHSQLLEDIVNRAYQKGIIVVGASGNDGEWDGSGDTVDYPARYESVVAVGSVDSSLNRSLFSSTGQAVEFSAPGQDIVSTYLNGQYAISSGTSMASPHVAGMFALLKEKFPNKSNVELREELQNYVVDLGFKGRDTFYGYGFTKYNVKKEEKKEATFVITKPIQDQKSLMDEKQLKEKIGIAKRNVELAEKYRTPLHVDMASKAIEGLPECPEKEEFLLRIGYVIKELEAKELEKKIKAVDGQVKYAEMFLSDSFINKAQQMVNELPDCPKKEEFQNRIENAKKELEAKELEKQIKAVEAQLRYAEKFKTSSFIKKTQQMINELPDCPEKIEFQKRLDAINS